MLDKDTSIIFVKQYNILNFYKNLFSRDTLDIISDQYYTHRSPNEFETQSNYEHVKKYLVDLVAIIKSPNIISIIQIILRIMLIL